MCGGGERNQPYYIQDAIMSDSIDNDKEVEQDTCFYHISLKVGLVFEGHDIPCEKTILEPIKEFIKTHIKAYKKTTRIVIIKSGICEAGYDEDEDDEDR